MDDGKLDVHVSQTPRGIVAKFSGDASIDHADELERHMGMLALFPPGLVVLDLADVTYISSIGLGILIRFTKVPAVIKGDPLFRIVAARFIRPRATALKVCFPGDWLFHI